MAARASSQRALDARVGLLADAPPRASASALASLDLKTASAASKRLAGSGESSVRPPSAASMARRTRLLTRTGLRPAGSAPATGLPVAASSRAPAGFADEDLLVVGAEQQPAVLQRLDDLRRQRVAAGRDAGDGGVGVGVAVGCELRQRLLVALRAARQVPAAPAAGRSTQAEGRYEAQRSVRDRSRILVGSPVCRREAAVAPPPPMAQACRRASCRTCWSWC